MLAMALLLRGGLLDEMGGEVAGVDGSGEGAWALATPAEGFLAASGAGELAHLLHPRLFRLKCRVADLHGGPKCIPVGRLIKVCTSYIVYACVRAMLAAAGPRLYS
jgi:hypothetical protein